MITTTTAKDYLAFDKLKDGRTVEVRAICPADKSILEEGMHHLSKQSLYFRFFIYKDSLSTKELDYFTNVDFIKHVALVAGFYDKERFSPAGTARYILSSEPDKLGTAEFAVTVAEEFQGLGFGTILLRHLEKIARANGVKMLTGLVLPENHKMLSLLNHSDMPLKRELDQAGEWCVSLSLSDQKP